MLDHALKGKAHPPGVLRTPLAHRGRFGRTAPKGRPHEICRPAVAFHLLRLRLLGPTPVDKKLIDDIATLRFLEDATNVLLIGPPGVGKTMLAVGLGHAAVAAGMRVHYTTAADLAARCHRAAIEGRWTATMRFS